MEEAIRWSPHSTASDPRFVIISVSNNRLQYCKLDNISHDKKILYSEINTRRKLPNFTAFDWSKTQEHFVGIGAATGEAVLLDLQKGDNAFMQSFPIKRQRKCNSIAFSAKNFLATGLDNVRNDVCMNIYDLNASMPVNTEPYRKLGTSEAISSIKFFPGQPDTLLAGVRGQCIRLYDLRDSPGSSTAQFPTRQVNNISIDPLDENFFISAGPAGDATVSIWDRRYVSRSTSGTPSSEVPAGSLLELRPAIDTSTPGQSTSIWSLRHSGTKRGCFGILANTGEIKIVETAQHGIKSSNILHSGPSNDYGGTPWAANQYVRRSHVLQYSRSDVSWARQYERPAENERVYAYDFMNPGCPAEGSCLIAMTRPQGQQQREVTMLRIPDAPPHINFTATNELYRDQTLLYHPRAHRRKIADDMDEIRRIALTGKEAMTDSMVLTGSLVSTETLNPAIEMMKLDAGTSSSSQSLHEDLLTIANSALEPEDLFTTLDVQRRRCMEGYLFDCKKNKLIVKDDPWLGDMWDLIARLDDLKADDGMVAHDLDMSYAGVHTVWRNTLKMRRVDNRLISGDAATDAAVSRTVSRIVKNKELPPLLNAVPTKFTEQRQLCLAICGWALPRSTLHTHSLALIEHGYAYKAIVLAYFKGHTDLAIDLLRTATRAGHIQNIGLAAIIAGAVISDDRESTFSWMLEESSDPYLTALLTYFINHSWARVVEMPQLALADRVGIALTYLDDYAVGTFIERHTFSVISAGSIEGLVLTGLDYPAIDLFEKYIARFGDLQTAVLALGRSQPLYSVPNDVRWQAWYDAYLAQMHVWHAFVQRAKFVAQHSVRAVSRRGKSEVKIPGPQVTIRCNNCQLNLARHVAKPLAMSKIGPPAAPGSKSAVEQKAPPKTPASAAGTVCPRCGAPMPRCGICMMWLGSPDPAKLGGAAALSEEDMLARQMTLCLGCGHGFHGNHAQEWFRRHQMCPVPDCQCMCGIGVSAR
ncbi:hypothetical protein EJ05DRAFT_452685 [Pseudovirgaria hyperparasitica]|uniref:Uncharacterized protein n=1 Tax=Pseudovirgaria hyperparasitica TaxID=470096 RepID=A0A6A6W6A6_9PEZI|nr:uncharacterized protein EJ05DRAFT_452685 [Pseudovirgaria hyperparasitica]KAF2758075.1 hypothetical protein EJ05DRAFT_452685 [Pseudovirgaria hyperparasitica]